MPASKKVDHIPKLDADVAAAQTKWRKKYKAPFLKVNITSAQQSDGVTYEALFSELKRLLEITDDELRTKKRGNRLNVVKRKVIAYVMLQKFEGVAGYSMAKMGETLFGSNHAIMYYYKDKASHHLKADNAAFLAEFNKVKHLIK